MSTHFGERLKALARALGKDDQDVAHDLGLSKAQMSHYTTGKRKVPSELLQKIVDTYGINPQFLFDKDAPLYMYKTNNNSDVIKEMETLYQTKSRYPYFPIGISAGLPIGVETITEFETIEVSDEILGKYAGSKNIYFMKVNGDSMNKIIPHNSLIAVKQVEKHQLKNGDIVVYSNGHDYAVKRFYDLGDKIVFKPESTDPIFTDYIIDKNNEDLRIHGKVIVYVVNVE